MVDGVELTGNAPGCHGSGDRGGDAHAIIDSAFDFRAFFVIIPGHDLDADHLSEAGVILAILGHGLEPGCSTLLADDAVGCPCRQRVIEPFVRRFE